RRIVLMDLPKPYYHRHGITIYNCDAAHVIGGVEADGVLTDPPCGIRRRSQQPSEIATQPIDPRPCLQYQTVAIFGGAQYAHIMPPTRCWIVWDLMEQHNHDGRADCELI